MPASDTAPNVSAQTELLLMIWAIAMLSTPPEAHGTGTALGDPTEVRAIRRSRRDCSK